MVFEANSKIYAKTTWQETSYHSWNFAKIMYVICHHTTQYNVNHQYHNDNNYQILQKCDTGQILYNNMYDS